MPELPEVETVVRMIRPSVVGRTIRDARVHWQRTVGESPKRFREHVVGARIATVSRRAKYIVIELQRRGRAAGAIVGHLRMSGRMQVEPTGSDAGHFVKVELDLSGGRSLYFIDVRKFGRFQFTLAPERVLAELGPEPLGPDFTPAWLATELGRRRRKLKPLLLDQSFLAGLGNIYVDEALFRARLHPLTSSERLGAPAARELHAQIRAVLNEAIRREGSSFDGFYRTPEGKPGSFQDQFQVYGRGGEPCRACGTTIERMVVGQRGTHVCPSCQKKPRAKPRLRRARG